MFNIQTPTEYTALEELKQMERHSIMGLQGLINSVKHAHNSFFNGKVPPEVKAQLLGTKLQSIFQAQEASENLIQALKPEYKKLGIPEKYEVTWNEDGSGAIVEKKVVEIEE
jgi:hypothetical protein